MNTRFNVPKVNDVIQIPQRFVPEAPLDLPTEVSRARWVEQNTKWTYKTFTVNRVLEFADNSIQLEGTLEDGSFASHTWLYPSGDACF